MINALNYSLYLILFCNKAINLVLLFDILVFIF